MTRPFAAGVDGVVVALPAQERRVLVQLLGQLDGLLDDGSSGAPVDPLAELVGFDVAWPEDEPAAGAGVHGEDAGAGVHGEDAGAGVHGEDAEHDGPAAVPDPALARLFPSAHRQDDAFADEFRRLTEGGLRARKRSGARLAVLALEREDPVVLATDEAHALLKALTDLRLVLADRIGLHTDEDAEALHRALARSGDSDEPWVGAAALYDALTWWQESLVGAITGNR